MDNLGLQRVLKKPFKNIKLIFNTREKVKKHEELLQKLQEIENLVSKNANQLEIAKSSFLKNIYHELRTPLNAIVGFTNLLEQKGTTQDQAQAYMQHINRSSREFLRIMDDIVQASLLEAGMVKIYKESCQPYSIMNELHAYFTIRKHLLEKNNIALLQNISDECKGIEMVADSQRITQIMSHLLDNALKFSEKGVVEYGYRLKGKSLQFYVKDTGIGGLEKYKEFVFKSFAKIDLTDTSRTGLGLGLTIAKRLANLMEGDIHFESNRKQGSIFYFNIPYLQMHIKNTKDGMQQETKKQDMYSSSIAL
jgi:signal transduction histidine kinase